MEADGPAEYTRGRATRHPPTAREDGDGATRRASRSPSSDARVRRADADLDDVREQIEQLARAVHDGNVPPEQVLPQEHALSVDMQKALQEKYEAMEARLIALEAERMQRGELGGSRGRAVTFANVLGDTAGGPHDGAPSQVAPATPQPVVRAGGGGDPTARVRRPFGFNKNPITAYGLR